MVHSRLPPRARPRRPRLRPPLPGPSARAHSVRLLLPRRPPAHLVAHRARSGRRALLRAHSARRPLDSPRGRHRDRSERVRLGSHQVLLGSRRLVSSGCNSEDGAELMHNRTPYRLLNCGALRLWSAGARTAVRLWSARDACSERARPASGAFCVRQRGRPRVESLWC